MANDLHLPCYLFMPSNAGSLAFMLHLPKPNNQITTEIKGFDPEILIPGIINPVRPSVLPSSVTDGSFSAYVKLAERFRGTCKTCCSEYIC